MHCSGQKPMAALRHAPGAAETRKAETYTDHHPPLVSCDHDQRRLLCWMSKGRLCMDQNTVQLIDIAKKKDEYDY